MTFDAWDQDRTFNYAWLLEIIMEAIKKNRLPPKVTLSVPGTGHTSIDFTITADSWLASVKHSDFLKQYVR